MRIALLTALTILNPSVHAHAQEEGGIIDKITNSPGKVFRKIDKRTKQLDKQPVSQTEKHHFIHNSILKVGV